jgi:hypothetical protein
MRLKWGHICQAARYDHPMWSFGGLFNSFPVPVGGGLTPPFFLVLAIEAESGEDFQGQTIDVEIRDSSGNVLTAQRGLPAAWRDLGPNHPKLRALGFQMPPLHLPGPGRYEVVATVSGQSATGSVEFFGTAPDGSRPDDVGDSPPAHATALDWGHLCFHMAPDPRGFLWLNEVTDFYPTPHDQQLVFNGGFVCQLSFGPAEGPHHSMRVEFVAPDGQVLRQFDEANIVAVSAGAGQWYRALCAMTVHNLAIPGPGDYAFRVSVNGDFVGSVEYPVIRIDPSKLMGEAAAPAASGTPAASDPTAGPGTSAPRSDTEPTAAELGLAPPLRLRWSHLCTAASYSRGRFQIPQLMQMISYPENQPAPLTATGMLALMFDATATAPLNQTLTVELVTLLAGESVGQAREFPLTFERLGEGYRLYGPAVVPLEGWPLPGPGDYAWRLRVGETILGAVPMRVVQMAGPKRVRELLPPPTPPGAPALELKWAHMLADFDFATFRTGSLANIVDYLRLPKRDRDIALQGYTLAMLLEGEMVDGIKVGHEVRLRFLDANGQPVLPSGDHVLNVDFTPLSENRLGRRVPVDLPDIRLPPGDYAFEVYVDGVHLGTHDLLIFRSS